MIHVEALGDAALSTLRAGLPPRIEALNLEAGAVALPVPGPGAYTLGGALPRPLAFPAVEVTPSDVDLHDITIGQVGVRSDAQVYVIAWLEDPDYPRLVRGIYRMGRACADVLLAPGAWGTGQVTRARAAYRTVAPEDRADQAAFDVLLGFAMLQFTVESAEAIG